eukprot:CAMPEP_0184696508 /NCGR_PEP_ID=MMETSP0313-20130426/3772_1 /TAXON_ID=2792 /ORGANISM="Porphyridium aerugineum, Strain SAG 1380-2" /LENGTH=194 /DNA_ID=CAMNT_0027155139 /DNA_START=185 /DNA_END=769 /DNA_ORIENTATION=+
MISKPESSSKKAESPKTHAASSPPPTPKPVEEPVDQEEISDELLDRAMTALIVASQQDLEGEVKIKSKEELIEEALNCPCIAKMKEGTCGDSFIAAYRCFLESETEPKGMNCMAQFQVMQECMLSHPDEYKINEDDDDKDASKDNEKKSDQSLTETTKEAAKSDATGTKEVKESKPASAPSTPKAAASSSKSSK